MTDPIVGIDLGTSNTVVAACDESGEPRVLADDNGYKIQPSVVSFHPNGSVIVGAEAKQRRIIDPRNTVYSVKRLIGRSFRAREIAIAQQRQPFQIKEGVNQQPVIVTRAGEFAIPEISAIVLDHVRNVARKALGTEVTRAVITVPAAFVETQRSATATAGAIAGLTVVRVLNEPTAAALAYGHSRQLDQVIAVYDFGGGTFDVTILKLENQVYEVLGSAGDTFLGGDDLDERLVDHMVGVFLQKQRLDLRDNELAMMRLRAVAEQTKIELSRRTRAIVRIDEIAYGPGGAPLNLELEITRDEFIAKIADVVDRTFPVCEEALKLAGLDGRSIHDVVLVGGTTKIPHVRERVNGFFGRPARTDVNPEEAVAIGASLQAQALQQVLSGKRQTAKSLVAPPGSPMSQRPETATPPTGVPGRTTTPRVASDGGTDPSTIPDGYPRRQTAPLGVPVIGRPGTERPVTRGSAVDRVGTAPGTPASTGRATLGRITRPGGAAPPIPGGNKTVMGIPAAPTPIVDLDSDSDYEEPTRPQTEQPTLVNRDAAVDFGEPAPQAAQARTMMMEGGPAATGGARPLSFTGPPPMASQAPTMVGAPVPAALRAAAAIATAGAAAGAVTMMGQMGQMPGLGGGPLPAPPSPTILDVTPRGLGIGTVAGYCEELIRRNSRLPSEVKRMFTTSRDKQQSVRIQVCQGESRRIDDNLVVGELVLDGLEPRPRGETTIEVTFAIDASGILQVRARDARTGQERRASLDIQGAQSPGEVDAARNRLRELRS